MASGSIFPPHFKGMDEVSRRECQMNALRKKLTFLGVAAMLYVVASFLLTSLNDDMPRRRIDQADDPTTLYQPAPANISTPLAWLLSFPNSGTSYTMRMIARTSQTLVATNYQKSETSQGRRLQPVIPGQLDGPFWPDPKESEYQPPSSYILTKTHCGFRCNDCGPSSYLKDRHSFETACAKGTRLKEGDDGDTTTATNNNKHAPQAVEVQYDVGRVEKAVHLIRNPFDNVVSRFHLERHRLVKENNVELLKHYPDSREGFRNFCQYMNDKYKHEVERSWLTDEISIIKNVPCRDDFFRYTVWHNLAFVVTDKTLHVPTFILHYEDYYSERFNETVASLLDFLELEQVQEPFPFDDDEQGRHSYLNYYTNEERQAIKQATNLISTKKTWDNVKHYFQ